MKQYLTQYYDAVTGWIDIQLSRTEDEARQIMSTYLKDHPYVREVRYKKVMK